MPKVVSQMQVPFSKEKDVEQSVQIVEEEQAMQLVIVQAEQVVEFIR